MSQFDVSNVARAFLDRKLDRAKVVLDVGQMVRSVARVRHVVEAVLSDCGRQDAKPFDVVRTGICYGLSLGIYLEREMRQYKARTGGEDYDLDFVAKSYLANRCPDQQDVEREIGNEVRCQKVVYELVAEVTHEIVRQQANPHLSVQIALIYGISLGIFLERDKAERCKEVTIQ